MRQSDSCGTKFDTILALTATAEDTIPHPAITGSQTSCQPQPAHMHAV